MPIGLPLPTAELQLPAVPNPDRHARTAESSASGLVQSVSAHAAMTILYQRAQNRRIGIRSAMRGNAVPERTKSAVCAIEPATAGRFG
jgi:hypothetical protein